MFMDELEVIDKRMASVRTTPSGRIGHLLDVATSTGEEEEICGIEMEAEPTPIRRFMPNAEEASRIKEIDAIRAARELGHPRIRDVEGFGKRYARNT